MNSRGVTGRVKEALIRTKPAINVKRLNVPVSPADFYVARTGASVGVNHCFSHWSALELMNM